MVFMSHKTGDDQAEREAKRITRQHRVEVYMAEWDDDVVGDSNLHPAVQEIRGGTVRAQLDRFMLEYLRVNEAACP